MTESVNNKKKIFSIKSVLAVALVALVITNIVVWVNHHNKRSEADSLRAEIISINEEIQQMTLPENDLEEAIESTKEALTAATENFPISLNRNEVMDFILDIAESCGVQVMPLVSEGWSDEEAGTAYRVLGFNGTVTGSMNEITNFIYELQNSSYETLTIRDVIITSQTDPHTENPTYYNDVPVSVRLSIAVYTCPQTTREDAV
jgi:hypothetical protein